MRNFYLDLAKICFGVGFFGCVQKLQDPYVIIAIGLLSLVLVIVFGWLGYNQKEH